MSEAKISVPKSGEHRSFGAELPVEARENRMHVVILQHPQEPDKLLGTALLCARSLQSSQLEIGLSWPNLKKLVGTDANPVRWGVLYLGSQKDAPALAPGQVALLDKRGQQLNAKPPMDGFIVIDGTWSQAKAIWWRNAWLLKLHRIILRPARPSRYGTLRKEPRADALSTIEAVAQVLRAYGNENEVADSLDKNFEAMLSSYRRDRQQARDAKTKASGSTS
jgi:DTW domain-containing protein YfiP